MLIILITAIIFIILSSILALVIITAMRRGINKIRYNRLDTYRELFRKKIDDIFNAKKEKLLQEYSFSRWSIKWKALEDVLFEVLNEDNRERIKDIFTILGYKSCYLKHLDSKIDSRRLSAIDKIGRLNMDDQIDKLLMLLEDKNPEICTASIMALARIGAQKAFDGILQRLPLILEKGNISTRILGTSLLSFGEKFIENLISYAVDLKDREALLLILEILTYKGSGKAIEFAIKNLEHEDSEIRTKAIKVLINSKACVVINERIKKIFLRLLSDPVWTVRFHIAKLLQGIKDPYYLKYIGQLLFDPKWQVRIQSAKTLASMGDSSIDIFLDALRQNDRFVRDAICEEIEKSGYVNKLIENVLHSENDKREKSKSIIEIMYRSGFMTPFKESDHYREILEIIGEIPE